MRFDEDMSFEVMRHKKERTGLLHDFYTDSVGVLRKSFPVVYVENTNGIVVPVCISDEPILQEECRENITDVLEFIRSHREALIKHWNGKWDDVDIGNYIAAVGKKDLIR